MANIASLTENQQHELKETVTRLLAPAKGIIAADQTATMLTREFKDIHMENTEENRRRYRQMLFSTDEVIGQNISGAILAHETVYQKDDEDRPIGKQLTHRGILAGVKVDRGVVSLAEAGAHGEWVSQGLDDLGGRCSRYHYEGVRFVKWRCVFVVGSNTPSHLAMIENANVLAKYARIAQQNGLVPVVHAEVLRDGNHDLTTCKKATETVLQYVFKALNDHNVWLDGVILMTNMVTPGEANLAVCYAKDIGAATVEAMMRSVPVYVPGIVFLSGGLSEVQATLYLNEINKIRAMHPLPWVMSFAFGRALQVSVIKVWAGDDKNTKDAHEAFIHRARANGLATAGEYQGEGDQNLSTHAHRPAHIPFMETVFECVGLH